MFRVVFLLCCFFFSFVAGEVRAADPAAFSLANRLQSSQIYYSKLAETSLRDSSARFLKRLDDSVKQLEGALSVEADEAYLLSGIKEQILSSHPDFAVLEKAYRAMCTELDQPIDFGVKKEWQEIRKQFQAHVRELRGYWEPQGIFELQKRVASLVADLRLLSNAQDDATHRAAFERIAANYRWCAERNQIPEQLGWIRAHFRKPNQVIAMSSSFLGRKINLRQSLPTQSMPVNEYDRGFHIHGQGIGSGELTASFYPNDTKAEIRLDLDGQANAANLQANRNRLTLFLGSYSQISGYATLYADEKLNITTGPHQVSVTTNTEVQGAHFETRKLFPNRRSERLLFNGSVRERIAERIAERNIPEMNVQTASKLQGQLSAQLSSQLATQLQAVQSGELKEKLEKFKKLAREQFVFPLERQDLYPTLSLRTDSQNLFLQGTFGPEQELTAGYPLPSMSTAGANSDVRGFVHESLFNQFSRILEGQKVEEEQFRDLFFNKLGLTVPNEFDITGDNPASLTLADVAPLEVQIDGGVLTATIRLKAFKAEKKVYKQNPVSLTVRYQPSIAVNDRGQRGGVQLDRVGEVALGTATEKETSALSGIVDRFFPRRAIAHGFALGKELKQPIGKFLATTVSASRGWLAVGWMHLEDDK